MEQEGKKAASHFAPGDTHSTGEILSGGNRGVPTGGCGGVVHPPPPTFGELVGKFYGWSVNVLDGR